MQNGDFNKLVNSGTYAWGGHTLNNTPQGFGIIEVSRADTYIVQKRYNDDSIATRVSYDNGENWSTWKYTTLIE